MGQERSGLVSLGLSKWFGPLRGGKARSVKVVRAGGRGADSRVGMARGGEAWSGAS